MLFECTHAHEMTEICIVHITFLAASVTVMNMSMQFKLFFSFAV